MLSLLNSLLFGSGGGLKKSDIKKAVRRMSFSKYLNYHAYDEETEAYINSDNTVGFLWECSPLVFAGQKTMKTLEGLFRAGLPEGSVLQLALFADPYVTPILNNFKAAKKRNKLPLVRTNTAGIISFFESGTEGMEQVSGIPIRNFRLFVSVKLPGDSKAVKGNGWLDIKKQLKETLAGANLHPRSMAPADLLEWARRFFNSHHPESIRAYDETIPIRKQIINAETVIREKDQKMEVGDKNFYCITPKTHAKDVSPLFTNELIGGIEGLISDADQIKTPFLYTVNVVFESLARKLHAKCNLVLQQEAVGSFSPSLQRKQVEYLRATDDLEKGVMFVRIMPIFWVWSDDDGEAADSIIRVRRIWENKGYVMQQDRNILKILFLAALPLNLYLDKDTLDDLSRDFTAQMPAVVPTLPVQADFAGFGTAAKLLAVGRKGQLAQLDFFDKGAVNQNVLVCATSGSGKSFLVNNIAFNYYSAGSLIRIIDIGGSYKKMTSMLGARYLDFRPDTDICLNPFTHIENHEQELEAIVAVFAQMAYSNSATAAPDDIEINLLRNAVRWAWQQEGNEADADTVYAFLSQFPEVSGLEALVDTPEIISVAKKLAFNIREFTSAGNHARLFIGPSTFDIRHDEFVVLELEHLRVKPELYRVVTLLVINAVTQDLYLSDRSRERMVIFDEAWQFLGDGAMLASVISEGYRRARKYHGSFMIITQSLLDLKAFGAVGDVIRANSAFKILLESTDFVQARELNLIDYDPFTMKLLQSIKSNPPKYSELFVETPFGTGVLRLAVDPYTYYICTSKASEIAEIDQLVKEGRTYDEAIREMVGRYNSK